MTTTLRLFFCTFGAVSVLACSCPHYAARHYAYISAKEAAAAAEIGFEPSAAPEAGQKSHLPQPIAPLPTGPSQVYGCDNHDRSSFQFTIHPAPKHVIIDLPVSIGGKRALLQQKPAAGGSKFESEELLFWVSGAHTRLDIKGTTYRCVQIPPEEAKTQSSNRVFRALGQEPGWQLTITPRKGIHLVTDYGERQVHTPYTEPKIQTDKNIYHAITEAHDLLIVIEFSRCQDAMSGKDYAYQVAVTLDGERYTGCGAD